MRSWVDLFLKYDTDGDDLLTKDNFMKMMVASGMKHVTYAESTFAFNIIARFKKTLNLKTFTNWAQSLHGMQQKRLI